MSKSVTQFKSNSAAQFREINAILLMNSNATQ